MRLLLLGGGKIGGAISDLLQATGDFTITVADKDRAALARVRTPGVTLKTVEVADEQALVAALSGQDAVVSALPYYLNLGVARAARMARAHYFDLTEDVSTGNAIWRMADGASSAFVPHCDLAPGSIQILAHHLAQGFERLRDVHMRVGALPQFPTNDLMYNLTWSTDGLINEYCNPCDIIEGGKRGHAQALDGLEKFSLDGVTYECFHTSGGLGTLCDTLVGRVAQPQLQDRALPRPPRSGAVPDARVAPGRTPRAVPRRAGNRDPDHRPGCGADLRHRDRLEGRLADASVAGTQDL